MRVGRDLLIELVFAKRQDRDEIGSGSYCKLDEPLAAFQYETKVRMGLRVEGFPCAADNDSDGTAHAFTIGAAFGEDVLA